MIFGTDGIRGLVDKEINSKLSYDVGKGLATYIRSRKLKKKIIIGCDTRKSSFTYLISLVSALLDYGIDVEIIGVVSTPMISFFVSRFDYSAGVMITASHNNYQYNGIKIFNSMGEKMNVVEENEIEKNTYKSTKKTIKKGNLSFNNGLVEIYKKYLTDNFKNIAKGFKIVVDCANGSNSEIAPKILKLLGAEVITIGCKTNGYNINKNCGANYIDKIQKKVLKTGADFGFAFDGDADRLVVILNNGLVLNGDDLLFIYSLYLKETNNLNSLTVAGTILTNLGIEKTLNKNNIELVRSDVGDKNVINLMKQKMLSLGGESSGHMCFLNYLPTCDALYNSIMFLKCYKFYGEKIVEIINSKEVFASYTKNISVDKEFRREFDNNLLLHNKIDEISRKFKDTKIVVRPSGTEPVIRLYVESESEDKIKIVIYELENVIKEQAL